MVKKGDQWAEKETEDESTESERAVCMHVLAHMHRYVCARL